VSKVGLVGGRTQSLQGGERETVEALEALETTEILEGLMMLGGTAALEAVFRLSCPRC